MSRPTSHTFALFPVKRRKPKLSAAWSGTCHPFTADHTGVSCVHCALPVANIRHGQRPPRTDA